MKSFWLETSSPLLFSGRMAPTGQIDVRTYLEIWRKPGKKKPLRPFFLGESCEQVSSGVSGLVLRRRFYTALIVG